MEIGTTPNPVSSSIEREFEFTAKDFDYLRTIVNGRAGIVVADEKYDMFYSRLARRVRALGLVDFKQYCDLIKSEKEDTEVIQLVNAITTNLTSFFRENHHFEFLSGKIIPDLLQDTSSRRTLKVWSAGCSTGEEPYSIAITANEMSLADKGYGVEVLATDIDSNVLAHASQGVYGLDRVEGLSVDRLQRGFLRGTGNQLGKVRIKPEVHSLVEFAQLNLISNWALPEPVDVVFCRNVIIYFDKQSKVSLVERIANNLKVGGYLFIGHSESLFRVSDRFELIGNTIYRKKY